MEERITELETRLAFMDDTVQQLNDVVARQQILLNNLEAEMKAVKMQLKLLAPALPGQGTDDTPPPHY